MIFIQKSSFKLNVPRRFHEINMLRVEGEHEGSTVQGLPSWAPSLPHASHTRLCLQAFWVSWSKADSDSVGLG